MSCPIGCTSNIYLYSYPLTLICQIGLFNALILKCIVHVVQCQQFYYAKIKCQHCENTDNKCQCFQNYDIKYRQFIDYDIKCKHFKNDHTK